MPTSKRTRIDTLTDVLRAINDVCGDEPPAPQTLDIIKAVKRMRDDKPVQVSSAHRVDYLEQVQRKARAAWKRLGDNDFGYPGIAAVETPLGVLRAETHEVQWRRKSGVVTLQWASRYTLNSDPITVAEIREAGLAQRPTSRNRGAR